MEFQVVLMAAGHGNRMSPLSNTTPKPLLPVRDTAHPPTHHPPTHPLMHLTIPCVPIPSPSPPYSSHSSPTHPPHHHRAHRPPTMLARPNQNAHPLACIMSCCAVSLARTSTSNPSTTATELEHHHPLHGYPTSYSKEGLLRLNITLSHQSHCHHRHDRCVTCRWSSMRSRCSNGTAFRRYVGVSMHTLATVTLNTMHTCLSDHFLTLETFLLRPLSPPDNSHHIACTSMWGWGWLWMNR
jgi:hypothetical protein